MGALNEVLLEQLLPEAEPVKVRGWEARDTIWLGTAVRRFLEAGVARGGDLLPTSRNVDTLVALGLAAAARGEPCLVALIDEAPVAYVQWTSAAGAFDSRWRSLWAFGSFTEEAERRRGIADALRIEALRIARAKGFERIVGPVQANNYRGVREFIETYGAWITTYQMELLL